MKYENKIATVSQYALLEIKEEITFKLRNGSSYMYLVYMKRIGK
jgi:hypothetical protein